MGKRMAEIGLDLLCDLVGCALFSFGVNSFTLPNHIAPGGVTGLSTILNHLFGIPVGLAAFMLNFPLLLLAFFFLGRVFAFKTLKSVLILSFMLDLPLLHRFAYTGDSLLAALFGGILIGSGLAIVFMRGSTTGGTDIVSRLLRLKFPFLQMGKAIMLVDLLVILLAAAVFGQIETALYGIIVIYSTGRMIDTVLYGMDNGKMVTIVSNQDRAIAERIIMELGRGITVLPGKGAFSGAPRSVLFCAVRKTQYFQLKRMVRQIDPTAFIIVTEASEIVGEGFKQNMQD